MTNPIPTPPPVSQSGTMNGKPVLFRPAKKVLMIPSRAFQEKLLCDGIVINLGDACVSNCGFCYVPDVMYRLDKPVMDNQLGKSTTRQDFQDVVIRRTDAIETLERQLLDKRGNALYTDPDDRRVAFMSTLVDPAPNMELLRETAEACNLILKHTPWQIRLLSKGSLLHRLVADGLIPEEFHQRLIFGFSTGTLDKRVARAVEAGTALVSKRLESLHWLQDNGFRTFGMICPSFPQDDYDRFSREICDAIRVDRCEDVWAEVLNARGQNFGTCLDLLGKAGLEDQAQRLEKVSGAGNRQAWEDYARATFEAHARNISPGKFHFLQYVSEDTHGWWASQQGRGAVLLGKAAVTDASKVPVEVPAGHAQDGDVEYLVAREKVILLGQKSSIATARALFEIHTYKEGGLWKPHYKSFEEYCQRRWSYQKSHAYRLLEGGRFVIEWEENHQGGTPLSEGQLRPLLKLPREHRIEFWETLVLDDSLPALTAAEITKRMRDFAREKGIAISPVKSSSQERLAEHALKSLRKAAINLDNHAEILKLLSKVEKLLATSMPNHNSSPE